MKLQIIAIGKKHDSGIAEEIDNFTKRISYYAPVEWKIIPASDSIDSESENILKSLNDRDIAVLLDEKGKKLSSVGFADFIQKKMNESVHRLVFIIGGAFGVNENVRKRAGATISLSDMTFPHQLVRLILAEQIYRAFSILKGEKYHHE